MIDVVDLQKTFKLSKKQIQANGDHEKFKTAVKGISFQVADNEIFGLLGPNGAGKTTTLRCLATLIQPTNGSVSINGLDGKTHGQSVRRQLAFLTSELKLDTHFNADYTVRFFGRLHGLDEAFIEKRMDHLFDVFGVKPFRFTKINDLSTGMKQKLSIVVSLIHDPQVVIFDEPTNGLDVVTAKAVTDYLKQLKREGKTIIVSTHMMHVAEKLCDRLAIMLRGEIHAYGSLQEIFAQTGTDNLDDAFFKLYEAVEGGQHV